ncbi:hypothetical protein D6851_07575 [Altericroceibacterium spongiae]|uniref:Uncharacterized protein n=1 Tax=Altericroceibacterium spongiae TaxID=2320269 RepID=A0A420EMX5_9SPHN|nr:hypothetical protein [Altericroceibacterium spongiae]RKF22040.1 hypothetical protein D6851_07575 [Altericroceibacterium spongiae]
MPSIKNLTRLGQLIAARHGWPAAKTFKSYRMEDRDGAILAHHAVELLKIFPETPDTAALISAALAVRLESKLDAPVHVVAGTLRLNGEPVFEQDDTFDGPAIFSKDQPEWNGHIWVMTGPYIVDAALFRIAGSDTAPARLTQHVLATFGPDKALYVDRWPRTGKTGFDYEPQYVLSSEEINRLMGTAFHHIRQNG